MTRGETKGDADVGALTRRLAAAFDVTEVRWKPQTVSGNRALVVAFVDARVIMDRLDDVVGAESWQDHYECLPDGAVVCRLRVKLGDRWITKEDVGGQSEQPDEGDRRKAAFSDALKRAAVKFGIGRYLYRLKPQWVDYDPQKRQIVGTPRLPASAASARPEEKKPAKAAPAAAPAAKAAPAEATKAPPPATAPATKGLPQTGEELHRRLTEKDKKLAGEGLCKEGDLVKHVVAAGVQKGLEKDLASWAGPAIQLAIDEVRAFEARHKGAVVKAA